MREEARIKKIKQVIETKLSLVSKQEELFHTCHSACHPLPAESLTLEPALENNDWLFQSDPSSGHIFLEDSPEDYLTKISVQI